MSCDAITNIDFETISKCFVVNDFFDRASEMINVNNTWAIQCNMAVKETVFFFFFFDHSLPTYNR